VHRSSRTLGWTNCRITALLQDPLPGLGGQRLRAGHNTLGAVDHAPSTWESGKQGLCGGVDRAGGERHGGWCSTKRQRRPRKYRGGNKDVQGERWPRGDGDRALTDRRETFMLCATPARRRLGFLGLWAGRVSSLRLTVYMCMYNTYKYICWRSQDVLLSVLALHLHTYLLRLLGSGFSSRPMRKKSLLPLATLH
jgi:hypothetical protein